MAALSAAPSRSLLAAFLPIARASLLPQRPSGSIVNRIPSFSQLRSSILPAALLPIPGILDALWEGILKAVPKKKTSHMYCSLAICKIQVPRLTSTAGKRDTGKWLARVLRM